MDTRAALRFMRRQAMFSTFVILTLALGIGAATAVFTLVQAVLLRDLPFADPDRLVWMYNARTERDRAPLSIPDLNDYARDATRSRGSRRSRTGPRASRARAKRNAWTASRFRETSFRCSDRTPVWDAPCSHAMRQRPQGRGDHERPLEASFRRRSGGRRPHRHPQRRGACRRRRDASGLCVSLSRRRDCGAASASRRSESHEQGRELSARGCAAEARQHDR